MEDGPAYCRWLGLDELWTSLPTHSMNLYLSLVSSCVTTALVAKSTSTQIFIIREQLAEERNLACFFTNLLAAITSLHPCKDTDTKEHPTDARAFA